MTLSRARTVGFVYSETFLGHVPPAGHPEGPDRLRGIVRHMKDCHLWEEMVHLAPVPSPEGHIVAVHSKNYYERVRQQCIAGGGLLDEGDTYASPGSFDAAVLAAGAVEVAVDAVVGGKVTSAFCAVRPPGHHAERDRSMGFCLFNNIAVGARYAQRHHGLKKVAILDWDVHHGNGTQHIFEEDPSVFYISLHQFPFYPGSGARGENGKGRGEGRTLNIPLPARTGEAGYLAAFDEEIVPVLREFTPDLLLVSAGFDAHRDDPLAEMRLTEDSYAKMTMRVRDIAPVISILEGGYNLDALGRSVEQHLRALGNE
jgi:acetoin utilization deacetylase AcuC-like enzyme